MKSELPKTAADKKRTDVESPLVASEQSEKSEIVLRGVPASPGIAIGRVHTLIPEERVITPRKIAPSEVEPELAKFKVALDETRFAIEGSRKRALAIAGITVGKIFDAHLMILDDVVFQQEVRNRVEREQFAVDFIANDVLGHSIELMEKQEG